MCREGGEVVGAGGAGSLDPEPDQEEEDPAAWDNWDQSNLGTIQVDSSFFLKLNIFDPLLPTRNFILLTH